MQYTDLSAEAGAAVAAQRMALDETRSAINCVTDTLAFGAMLAIRNAGEPVADYQITEPAQLVLRASISGIIL